MKKSGKARMFLFAVLVVLLAALIGGYFLTRGRAPSPEENASSTENTAVQTTNEPTTEEPTTAAPATEKPTEKPTAEPTTVAKPADDKVILVSPTGDKWALTVVNHTYALPEGYTPKLTAAVAGSAVQLDERVAPYYQAMYDAAKKDGCTLTPYSGYRSYARQKTNYENKIASFQKQGMSRTEAIAATKERIMPPGHSEHNMGFAMDIVSASASFANTKESKWLQEHAHEYGFIMSYPKNKVSITKVMYEPWHYRYVGKEAATAMHQSGQCLEEYLGMA